MLGLGLVLSGCSAGEGATNTPGATGSAALAETDKGTAPISDTLALVQRCMEDQGVTAEYDGRGGLSSPEQTTEQGELWTEIYDQCAEAHGVNEPWTEADLKELYRLEVANHECLIAAGYESGEPPSEQAFIDSYLQESMPYQSVNEAEDPNDGSLFLEATQACPPPLWSFG